jgi:hypothetical protein
MMPVHLTDDELAAVMAAAQPIARHHRDSFLRMVAAELARVGPEHGPGDLHRGIRVAARSYFDPPLIDGA